MRVHHRNLTSLVGHCDEDNQTALIYEFMANGNLQEYLSGYYAVCTKDFCMIRKLIMKTFTILIYVICAILYNIENFCVI